MYQDDSFFSLSGYGAAGLIVLSLAMLLGLLGGGWWLMQGRGLVVRLGIAVLLFVAFVWLSPQVYYAYYMLLFDGLPVQWVAKWPVLETLLGIVTFSGRSTLAAHGQGAIFWALVILALVAHVRRRP